MQDFYNQIAGRPEDDIIGSAQRGASTAPQWLDFPGCVFIRGEFRADPDRPAIVGPGLFISVALDEGAGRGILTRTTGAGQMTAIAVREIRRRRRLGSLRRTSCDRPGASPSLHRRAWTRRRGSGAVQDRRVGHGHRLCHGVSACAGPRGRNVLATGGRKRDAIAAVGACRRDRGPRLVRRARGSRSILQPTSSGCGCNRSRRAWMPISLIPGASTNWRGMRG